MARRGDVRSVHSAYINRLLTGILHIRKNTQKEIFPKNIICDQRNCADIDTDSRFIMQNYFTKRDLRVKEMMSIDKKREGNAIIFRCWRMWRTNMP